MSPGRTNARAALAAVGVLVAMAFGAVSASAETVEFTPPTEGLFTVPAGVSQLEVAAVGGAGGLGCSSGGGAATGGSGAKVTATITGLVAGEELKVRFGGGGAGGSGFPCVGGAGGGRAELLGSSPLVVAGGGGGGGGSSGSSTGGAGGSAKALVGDNGLPGTGTEPQFAGGGGEGGGASPGKGGEGTAVNTCGAGFAGMLETGGKGGGPGPVPACDGGGGGGGGYKGGGGGGSAFKAAGGGGAGSSFIASSGTGAVASGTGEAQKVLVTYTIPTVEERLGALLKAVTGVGPGKALANKVKAIQGYVAANNKAGACTELTGFLSLVKAQKEKKQITQKQAEEFTKEANEIKIALGC